MLVELYVSNLPPGLEESQVIELIDLPGTITSVSLLINQRTNLPRNAATLDLETEERFWMVLRLMNRKFVGDYRLLTSPKEPTQNLRIPPHILKGQSKSIAEYLGEADFKPKVQIHRMIRLCGVDFVQALLDETNRIEKEGGLMLPDGTRRRTKGGVFFHLARNNISHKILKPIFFAPLPEPPAQRTSWQPRQAAPKEAPPKPKPRTAEEVLTDLRQSYRQAQQKMTQLQSSGAATNEVMAATQRMFLIKRQIDAFLKKYPNLQ